MLKYLAELFEKPISGEWGEESIDGHGVRIIRTTNFTNIGKLDLEKEVVTRNIGEEKVIEKKLQYGDIIIEKSGGGPNQPVGRVVFFDRTEDIYLCNNFTSVLRTKEKYCSKYCLYVMLYLHKTGAVLKFQNKTTGIVNLKLNDYLESTEALVPPLEIQKKIAEALDKAQALIDKRKKQIQKLDEFLQSVFLDMFGDPITNPRIWRKIKISEFAKVDTGATPSRNNIEYYENGDIPWIKTTEVKGRHIYNSEEYINQKAIGETNCKIFPRNTILVAMYGQGQTRGRVGLMKIEGATNQACGAILPQNKINIVFLFNQLNYRYGELRSLGRGGNQPNLNLSMIKNFEIVTPPIELQNKFVEIVEKTEAQKELMQKSLKEMENNFQSIMQKAFRGELF